MPTIRRVANCKIAIYADDHMRHIEYRGFRAIIVGGRAHAARR